MTKGLQEAIIQDPHNNDHYFPCGRDFNHLKNTPSLTYIDQNNSGANGDTVITAGVDISTHIYITTSTNNFNS